MMYFSEQNSRKTTEPKTRDRETTPHPRKEKRKGVSSQQSRAPPPDAKKKGKCDP
jgi:hypothetical protein